jgi:DNA-binding transcriptional ArsR family regulator
MGMTPYPTNIKRILKGDFRVKHDGKFMRILDDDHCVRKGDTLICDLLAGLAAHYFRSWCFPSQKKICELFERMYHRKMSERTLNRHLNALERDHYIHRTRRIKSDPRKGTVYRSTLYKLGGEWLKKSKKILRAFARWNLPEKMMADLKGELRSGIQLPFSADHPRSSILRL